MNTVLVVDLIKGVPCPWPRLESDTHIMSAGPARPLEDAFRIAQHDMVTWVASLCGLDLLGPGFASSGAMGGAHARLRELAAEYRA
jgi:hypothetical protein